MELAVVGAGYVGLVTGTCFAETGNNVVCIDNNIEKVRMMESGTMPIFEPGLDLLFKRNIDEGRLKFETNLEKGISDAEVIFLALPTPSMEDGSADLSYILNVALCIAPLLKRYTIVVIKSTVPVGTCEKVKNIMLENCSVDCDVVSNPEFLREGVAVEDFMKPERVIVGTRSEKAKITMETLYAPYVRQGNPILIMDEKSSELTKYAANSFLALKITYMNEMANLCERVGANVDKVRIGIGSDSRIGNRFLFAGLGYGGSCFPKDVRAMLKIGEENNYQIQLLEAIIHVNEKQKSILIPKILNYFETRLLIGKRIALWGLSFKPNTDDIREAPSLTLINALLSYGAEIVVYDPVAMTNVRALLGDAIKYSENAYDALIEADALVIVTEWAEFRAPDFFKIGSLMKSKVIFDGRNIYQSDEIEKLGFYYESIGRGKEAKHSIEFKLNE